MLTEIKTIQVFEIVNENAAIILFREKEGHRELMLGFDKKVAIFVTNALRGKTEKPLWLHEFTIRLLDLIGFKLLKVTIPEKVPEEDGRNRFRTFVFFEKENKDSENERMGFEVMPSDAVTLALYAKCPILIDDDLLREQADASREFRKRIRIVSEDAATKISDAIDRATDPGSDDLPKA
jgi:bifunctional DNase/RNase